jgi:hypothetical protein
MSDPLTIDLSDPDSARAAKLMLAGWALHNALQPTASTVTKDELSAAVASILAQGPPRSGQWGPPESLLLEAVQFDAQKIGAYWQLTVDGLCNLWWQMRFDGDGEPGWSATVDGIKIPPEQHARYGHFFDAWNAAACQTEGMAGALLPSTNVSSEGPGANPAKHILAGIQFEAAPGAASEAKGIGFWGWTWITVATIGTIYLGWRYRKVILRA